MIEGITIPLARNDEESEMFIKQRKLSGCVELNENVNK